MNISYQKTIFAFTKRCSFQLLKLLTVMTRSTQSMQQCTEANIDFKARCIVEN